MIDLHKLLDFTRLLHAFRQIRRFVRVNEEDRWENDVEHSYYLAMLGWYLIDSHDLDLDCALVLKYALIHDLVEVYAGDTYIYSADQEWKDSKEQREQEAAERLQNEFPHFEDLHETIKQYEQRQDKESRFVYALDKIQPMLSIYTDEGRTWKEEHITLEMLIEQKQDKVTLSPEVEACFDELISILRKEEQKLFSA